MSEEDENAAASAAAPAAAGKSKVLPLLLVINTLLLAGVLIFVMKRPAAHAESEGKAQAEHAGGEGHEGPAGAGKEEGASGGLGPTLRFDNFTVQLKSADVDRYAHLSIEIEVADEVAKGAIEKRVPPVRDAILSYLSDRTAEELRGSEGLTAMKESLVKRLDEVVPGKRIRNLYITDFIIQ